MDNKGLFDGWFEAVILVVIILAILVALVAFPNGFQDFMAFVRSFF